MSGWLQPPTSLGTALISPATDRQTQVFSAGGWAAAGLILRCTQTVCKNETKKWNMELQHQSAILLPRVDAALMSAAEKNQMIPERSDSGGQAATEPKRQPEFGSNWENWALLVQLMAHIFRAQWRKYLALNSKQTVFTWREKLKVWQLLNVASLKLKVSASNYRFYSHTWTTDSHFYKLWFIIG